MCISTLRICILVGLQNLGRFQYVVFFIKNFYHIISLVILPLYLYCCFLFCCIVKAECVPKLDVYRIMCILEYNTDNQCFFMGNCSVCSTTVVPSFVFMQQNLKLLFKTAFPKLLSHYILFHLLFLGASEKEEKQ